MPEPASRRPLPVPALPQLAAPGATLAVYFTVNTDAGFVQAINAAIQRGLENMKKYLEKVL